MIAARLVAEFGDAGMFFVHDAPLGGSAHLLLATQVLRAHFADAELVVARRPSGRPRLLPPYRELGISLSSRRELLAVGFSRSHDVGVDLEIGEGDDDPVQLAADHFAPGEARIVAQAVSRKDAMDAFLRFWTVKEAVLKATGRGVYEGLDEPDCAPVAEALLAGADVDIGAGPRTPAATARCLTVEQAGQVVHMAIAILAGA